jgi:hypothetical protein
VLILRNPNKYVRSTADITLRYDTYMLWIYLNASSEQTQAGYAGMCNESPGKSYLLERQYKET